jgi:hypothetical protein
MKFAVPAAACCLAPGPALAQADVITEAVPISATVGLAGTVQTSRFAAFDPTLGELVSVSATLSGTTDFTGVGSPGGDPAFHPAPPGIPFTFAISNVTDATRNSKCAP